MKRKVKQNTRIEKLMHNKRMKKIVHVTTVAMLICPLVIGAVNALANTEESEPKTAETTPTEETATSEPLPTVESTDLPVESTEPLPSAPESTSPTESTEDTSTTILTGTADEVGLDTSGIRSAMASVEEARMYELRYTAESFAEFNSTVQQYYSNGQTIITATDWTNTMLEQDQFWIDSNTNNMTSCLSKLVYDSEETVVERHRLELAQLLQEHNARIASDYTPESWKAYTDYLNSADPNHQGTILEATQKIVSKKWNPMFVGVSGGYVYSLWPYALSLLVEAETVNYIVKCVDENGFAIDGVPDITKTAKKGDSITETAPEIEYFFVLGDDTQTKTIDDNTVFTFKYRRLVATGLFHDVIGDATAKAGETKTYQYKEVMYFNNATMTETVIDIDDSYLPLISSDPSDVIVNGTITFGNEGTRTLVSANNSGTPLEVTVTKDNGAEEPTVIDTILTPSKTNAKVGEIVNFVLTQYFDDESTKVLPLGANETISLWIDGLKVDGNSYAFNKEGKFIVEAISNTGEGAVMHSNTVEITVNKGTITPPTDEIDTTNLEQAIKNAEAKLKEGGWVSVADVEKALAEAKQALTSSETQVKVDTATKALDDAISSLKKKDAGKTSDGDESTTGSSNGSNSGNAGTSNVNNQSNHSGRSTSASKINSGEKLPDTGEKETFTMFLTGIMALGLTMFSFMRKREDSL